MSAREYQEHHLTPRGWETGIERTELGHISGPNEPSDRVKSVRMGEEWEMLPHAPKKYEIRDIFFENKDNPLLKELVSKFGEFPPGW